MSGLPFTTRRIANPRHCGIGLSSAGSQPKQECSPLSQTLTLMDIEYPPEAENHPCENYFSTRKRTSSRAHLRRSQCRTNGCHERRAMLTDSFASLKKFTRGRLTDH